MPAEDLRRRFASMASDPRSPKGVEASFRPEDGSFTFYPVGERSCRLSREQAERMARWLLSHLSRGDA